LCGVAQLRATKQRRKMMRWIVAGMTLLIAVLVLAPCCLAAETPTSPLMAAVAPAVPSAPAVANAAAVSAPADFAVWLQHGTASPQRAAAGPDFLRATPLPPRRRLCT